MPTTPVTPYVPQYITVHLGAPSAAAENVTVSFPEYVKNVASSEIYPTWEPAAIRANILAIISFALNRVYTEYYPTRSFPSPEFSVAPGEASVHLNLVQSMFCGLSRVLNGVETCDVSGVNNAATEHNIKWIQHLNHRPETGTLDQESWNTLSRLYTMFVTSAQSPWTTRPELFMP